MEDAGRHAGFIWSAYGVTAVAILALIGRAVLDGLRQRRALAELERAADPRQAGFSRGVDAG